MTYATIFLGLVQLLMYYGTYGYKRSSGSIHYGIDLVGLDSKDVRAVIGGKVVHSKIVTDRSNLTWEWGNFVCVQGDDGLYHYYCHLKSRAVAAGQRVEAGQVLGVMGNTGNAVYNNPPYDHVYYEVRKSLTGKGIDPKPYLSDIKNDVGIYGAPLSIGEPGNGGTVADNALTARVYAINTASESFGNVLATALEAKKAGGELVLLGPDADGDAKARLAYSRMARQYTAENRALVVEGLLGEMGPDEVLVPCDGYTRLFVNMEPVGEATADVLDALAEALGSGAPFCVASPNVAGRGCADWYLSTTVEAALEGTGAEQMKRLSEEMSLPGAQLIGG